ncbi:MAG TPA: hypothetical protein P5060_02750 [Candidatus Absconditabacterales bacterium]|nr:hypothetical protein [Candidatus Absconditabacterales bacterium]
MVLNNQIENQNHVEEGKESIRQLGFKAEKLTNNKEFGNSVREGVKEFFEDMKGRITFREGIKKIEGIIPDELKGLLENLSDKENIRELQEKLDTNYNPIHESTGDGVPGVFTLGALLNNIGGYSNISKVEYLGESENKEEYSNFIGTLPEEVRNTLKSQNNAVSNMIIAFEEGNLDGPIVKEAQKFLQEKGFYLGHKSSLDGVPGQHTQNAMLNYALSLT